MNEAIEAFIAYIKLERNFTPASVEAYSRGVRRFCAFAEANGARDVAGITPDILTAYLVARANTVSARTRAHDLVTIRGFAVFLLGEKLIPADFTLPVELPRISKPLPQPLPQTEIEMLIAARSGAGPLLTRDVAMITLAYAAGLRVSELIRLPMEGLDLDAGTVLVLGKGRRERRVPIGERATIAVRRYLELRPLLDKQRSPFVFLTRRGQPMTRTRFHYVLRDAAKRAGISKPVHAHQLRHSCATDLLDGGCDARVVQKMLGHRSIGTTQQYLRVSQVKLREVYYRSHPAS